MKYRRHLTHEDIETIAVVIGTLLVFVLTLASIAFPGALS